MRTRRGRERRRSRRTISLVLFVVLLCVTGVLTGGGSSARPAPDAPPSAGSIGAGAVTAALTAPHRISPHAPTPTGDATGPRVAYTSDTDDIYAEAGGTAGLGLGATHTGELSNASGGDSAYVSTTGNTNGEVYLNTGTSAPAAITCDGLVHTHPTVLDGNQFDLPGVTVANNLDNVLLVAYGVQAANSTTTTIQIAVIDITTLGSGTLTCASPALTRVTLPAQTGSNFWPTWGPSRGPAGGGSGNSRPTLIYTSTRDNPLGDLYYQPFGSTTVTRLTDGGTATANTQPSFTRQGNALLFTTTQYRKDQSLGTTVLQFATTGPDVAPTTTGIRSAWTADNPPQSSAATDEGPYYVLYTSTDGDPLGAVRTVATPDFDPAIGVRLALSHIGAGSIAPATPVGASGDGSSQSGNSDYTADDLSAGISDVLASDPTSTRAILRAFHNFGDIIPADADAPSYSPDGTKIVYSEATDYVDGNGRSVPSRQLYVANSDGTNAQALNIPFAQQTDEDLSPDWSPDGAKIAFTRVTLTPSGGTNYLETSSRIYIASGVDGTSPTIAALNTPDTSHYWDAQPSWSPDGKRLVITRQPEADLDTTVTATPRGSAATPDPNGSVVTFVASVANDGSVAAVNTTVVVTLAKVTGTQAWTNINVPAGCTTGAATDGSPTVTCVLNSIGAGSQKSVQFTAVGTGPNDAGTTTPTFVEYPVQAHAASSVTDSYRPDNDNSTSVFLPFTHNAVINIARQPNRSVTPSITVGRVARVRPALAPVAAAAPRAFGTVSVGGVRGQGGFTVDSNTDGKPYSATPNTGTQLWVVDATTGAGAGLDPNTTQGDCNTGGCAYAGRSPAWSPDGLHIAFADGSQLYDLTLTDSNGDGVADDPAVGNGVAAPVTGFTTSASGITTPMPSRSTIESADDPAWWPDGSAIVFTGQPAGLPMQRGIYIINTDGTGIRAIAQGRGPESEPAVQPQIDLGITLTSAPTDPADAPTDPAGDTTDIYTEQSSALKATVTNNGPSRVVNPHVTFTIPTGMTIISAPAGCLPAPNVTGPGTITCTITGVLGVGDTATVTIIANADTSYGNRTFTADVYSGAESTTPADSATTTFAVRPKTHLAVVLTATPQTLPTGHATTVTATVTNNGAGTANGTTLTIDVPENVDPPTALTPSGGTAPTCSFTPTSASPKSGGVVTCDLGALATKQSQVVSFKATSEDPTTYLFQSEVTSATADDGNGSDRQSNYPVRWTSHAGLSVLISANPLTIALGEQTTVTTTVHNSGPDTAGVPEPSGSLGPVGAPPATDPYVTLTIALPTGMSVPTPPAGCTIAGTTMTCQLAPFAANETRTFTFTSVGQVLGDHTYTAHVDSNTADDDPSDNTASTTVTVVRRIADLSVTIMPSQPSVTPGTEFDAVVTVRNDGPYDAENSTLDTTFDPRLQPVSLPTCAADGSTCALGTLAPGETTSYVVTLNAKHDGTPPASYTANMSATVATTTTESDTTNNTAAASVRVVEKPYVADVAVTIHLPKVAYVGGTVTATIVVANLGPQTASKVRLTTNVPARLAAVAAPLCVTGTQACTVGTLAAGASRTYTLQFTPKRLTPARNYGAFVSAHVTTTTAETITTNNRDRERLPVHQPQLRLLPPIGTPGSVTLAFGQFLPPNALVTLTWRTGITAYAGPYRVDPDGTITVPVQVLRRDELGNRRLVLAGKPGRFGKVGATMLVVLASAAPPKFFGRG